MPSLETELVPVVTDKGPDIQTNAEPSKSGKALVGIIYPPLEIRNIVDKTASFVARNGPEFESRIKQHEANNPRFNFLTPTDPYHSYYQHKVRDFAEGKALEPPTAKPVLAHLPQKVQDAIKAAEFVPKEPPPEFEFCADPSTINPFDIDLMKLAALFVARNGRQFLTQLMTREARNYQFDFLKPQHSNFSYFTKLVEQYTKVLLPPKNIVEVLKKELEKPSKTVLADKVRYRVEWERHQRRIKERHEAELERERVAYAQVDWHDFVVVQTVDFQPHETASLPPPCQPKDVGARILAQQRLEASKISAQTMEMEVESEGEEEPEEREGEQVVQSTDLEKVEPVSKQVVPAPPVPATSVPAPPNPDNVVIRKDYNPRNKQVERARQTGGDQNWVISPLTGEKVPADKLAEHMRFNTVDAQYFAQKERQLQERQDDEPVYAPGLDITANILNFAERRTDIFGVGSRGAEQTVIGKKLGEEDAPIRYTDSKVIWDGHATSVEAASRAAQSQVTIEEQIAQIHRSQGLLVDQDRIGPKAGTTTTATGTTASTDVAAQQAGQPQPPPPPVRPAVQPRPVAPQISVPAAFALRQTMVPVVQMAPTPVLLVQTPMHVGQFMSAPPGHFGAPGFGAAPNFFPPPPHMMGGMLGGPHGGVMVPQQQGISEPEEASAAKRAKVDEQSMVDEVEWLRRYGNQGPVSVAVVCPTFTEKPEWRLAGQTISVTIDLTESISTLKSKIQDATNLPSGKQKLVYEGIFVKDSQSLASYNFQNGSVVQLQLKERGGRKK